MEFKVTTQNKEVHLEPRELILQLIQKLTSVEKPDHTEMGHCLSTYLMRQEALDLLPIRELITMSFTCGYFYRIFMEKNTVEITGLTKPNPRDSGADA